MAEIAGGALVVAGDADVAFEGAADPFFDAPVFERVDSSAPDDAGALRPGARRACRAPSWPGSGAAETLGEGAFEHPGGCPPMGADGLLHGPQRAELGVRFGAAELVVKLGISIGLAADGIGAAADVSGRFAQSATTGDEGTNLAVLCFVESARPASAGRFWVLY